MRVDYRIEGPMNQLLLPQGNRQRRFRHELWHHTCLELFLAPGSWQSDAEGQQQAYVEWNLALDGSWACYLFSGYRLRSADLQSTPPVMQRSQTAERLQVRVDFPTSFLPQTGFSIGLHAILEEATAKAPSSKTHWSLLHPNTEQPDFHDSNSFVGT